MEIWLYSAGRWGVDRANAYASKINAEIANLARHPLHGSDRSDLHDGLRKAISGSHHIYYLFDDTMIDVVRILHQRQDAPTALRP